MKRFLATSGAVLVATTMLSSCRTTQPDASTQPTDASASSSTSSVLEVTASAEGVLLRSGIGIAMEGTHRLITQDGQELLLESTVVNLNQYLDRHVQVTGKARATVEVGGHILRVEEIAVVDAEVLEETSSTSSVSSSSSSSVALVSSPSSSSVRSVARSSVAAVSSVAVSSPPATSSSSAAPSDAGASIAAMAKASVDATNFNQTYCSSHIGFCVPYHRNWYFQSFGANVPPNLWHVEFADHSVEEAGQGVIMVNLVAGPLAGTEGVAMQQGGSVVVSRQWTGGRHFEISGPTELRAAVEFMASGLSVYETPQQ